MTKKPSGLAAFTPPRPATAAPVVEQSAAPGERRGRGQGETVALTVRISRADWTRLHALAISQGSSLQRLAVEGFSAVLAKEGLPPMEKT